MLDERVLAVLARLEAEDASERDAGLPASKRSRQVEATAGRFLFALSASQAGIEVLEIGGSRGYSSIWLAAGARVLGGRLVSLEHDPVKCSAWRAAEYAPSVSACERTLSAITRPPGSSKGRARPNSVW